MKKLGFLIITIILLLSITSCGVRGSNDGVVLVVGIGTDPIILDPPMYIDVTTHNLNMILYNRLFDLSPTGELIPDLAISMPLIEEDGTKYTIKIREGVRFHNGNILTIDDVIFSFRRGAFHERSQMRSIFAMMYDIEKINDHTFTFRTGQFDPSLAPAGLGNSDLGSFEERGIYYRPVAFGSQINQLAWLGASILCKQTMENAEADGTIRDYGISWAIGTGAYKFHKWDEGDSVTFLKFEDYFDKTIQANPDRIEFKTIRDPAALKTAFMNREVDLIQNVVPLDARELEEQGGTILTTAGYFGYHYLAFNMNSQWVGQVSTNGTPDRSGNYNLDSNSTKLRMAIFHSVNPTDIVNSPDIIDGRGIVSRQYIETLPFGRITDPYGTRLMEGNDTTGYFDPTKARELFDTLPESYKQPGILKLTALSGSVFVKQALVIKDQVRRVLGVDLINIEQVALSELASRRGASDPNVWDLLVNWTQTDDSYYIFVAFDGNNTSLLQDTKYFNNEAQVWIESGNSLPNGPDRSLAYQNAHKIILNDAPRLPLVAMQGISASQPNISGVTISPSGSLRLTNTVKN